MEVAQRYKLLRLLNTVYTVYTVYINALVTICDAYESQLRRSQLELGHCGRGN